MSDVLDKVKEIVRAQLQLGGRDLEEGSNLEYDLGADDLDRREIYIACEEAYGVDFPDDALETVRTVRDVVDYIRANTV